MSYGIAAVLHGFGVEGPRQQRQKKLQDQQEARTQERHGWDRENHQIGIKQKAVEFDEKQSQERLNQALIQAEVSKDPSALFEFYNDEIPNGQQITDWDRDDQGNFIITKDNGETDQLSFTELMGLGISLREPGALTKVRRHYSDQQREDQETEDEREFEFEKIDRRHRNSMTQIEARKKKGGSSGGSLFGSIRPEAVTTESAQAMQDHFDRTGEKRWDLLQYRDGAKQSDRIEIERRKRAGNIADEMLTSERGNPVQKFIERNPDFAESIKVTATTPYPDALVKIEESIYNRLNNKVGISANIGESNSEPDVAVSGYDRAAIMKAIANARAAGDEAAANELENHLRQADGY